jgi:secreted PhoX family phosphatase
MSQVDDDIVSNFSNNPTFDEIVEARLSRRAAIGGGVATAITALGGVGALLDAVPAEAKHSGSMGRRRPRLGFQAIPVSTADKVVVPPGYTAEVLIAWGDPISKGPAFAPDASNSADDQEQQWGMHNDGMVYFPFDGSSSHGLLVQNHEYTDDELLFPDGTANWNAEKTRKSLAAHGVGIIEVRKSAKRGKKGRHWWHWDAEESWEVVRPSRYARRITGSTPIKMGGPAAGDPRVGKWALGTLNNCAMGYTPWGTYLACEENFNGYFRKTGTQTPDELRYGITAGGFGYLWHTTDDRFDANKTPTEPYRFGWVTEINPFKPNSTPVKRTALGRFKHEGAWVQEARDGRVVVYSGDDERFEYIYRYVSALPWKKSFLKGIHPLDHGTLYAAKFNVDGTGQWLPLTPDNPALAGWTLADILIRTRTAADLAGATKMDRPEWIDTFPDRLTAIATLTNNTNRGVGSNPGTDAANPRVRNTYGNIIQWSYARDWTEDTFYWEHFAMAGDPAVPAHGSTIVGDKYGSPDGIYVDPTGLLWIQTDVSGSTLNAGDYAGFGNNQMLAADPYTRETRRFLVGPNICEVTGVFMTPDRKTMFCGIQHPGEHPTAANDPSNPKQFSSWPDGDKGQRPRSATLVITKDDGGEIGT